ncbi:acyltransferase domain-containing protein [Lysinibacillus sphaericus]|uniref:acyltransferase domain-containing protein n=1 Tax=Lysinibacillus sphaericus TaxID=1421 RepID=UPI00163BBCF2|nr:ACP S-malonyltransferase [Lysinibacillus sp. SDF0037]
MDYFDGGNAFLFQGVGSEYQSLLHLLDEEQLELLRKYCSIVEKELDLDLWDYLFYSKKTKYDDFFNDWIAIYTCDNIVFDTYISIGVKPKVFLGYSMGLITAMSCGKSISFETGLHMLLTIYEYPKDISRHEESMATIIGLNYQQVVSLIEKNNFSDTVKIASENSKYCIVISGNKSDIIKILGGAEEEGAIKVVKINVPYAFHTPFAEKGIDKFIDLVERIKVDDSRIPIISVFTQNALQSASDLKKELVKNMPSSMNWKCSIEKMIVFGITTFIEVSLDDSLTKISRVINTDYKFLSYKKIVRLNSKH